ncbi:MAG TPA: hypothetical protein VMU34_05445 [Mycobacterium sp.]|nr:hypothetical protein [Mycobacterium sp.]
MSRNLVERIRQIIDDHRAEDVVADGQVTCGCGAENLSDHPRHVAEQIVDGLRLAPDVEHVKKRIRYDSAWLDWELTQLEGAECWCRTTARPPLR